MPARNKNLLGRNLRLIFVGLPIRQLTGSPNSAAITGHVVMVPLHSLRMAFSFLRLCLGVAWPERAFALAPKGFDPGLLGIRWTEQVGAQIQFEERPDDLLALRPDEDFPLVSVVSGLVRFRPIQPYPPAHLQVDPAHNANLTR